MPPIIKRLLETFCSILSVNNNQQFEVYESALIACHDVPVQGAAVMQTGEQVNLEMFCFRVRSFYVAQSLVDKFVARFKGRPVTEQPIARFIPLIRKQLPENGARTQPSQNTEKLTTSSSRITKLPLQSIDTPTPTLISRLNVSEAVFGAGNSS